MPAITPDPRPPWAALRASAAAIGDVREDELTPLHRSLAALRVAAAGTRSLRVAAVFAFAFDGLVERARSLPATGVAGAAATGAEATGAEATGRAGAAADVFAVRVGAGTRAAGRSRTAPLAIVEFTAPEVDFAGALAGAAAGAAAVAAAGAGAAEAAGASAGGVGAPAGAGVAV